MKVLRQEPKNGFALVHLGFIVKTSDHDYAGAIPLLQDGIASDAPGVIDGRFFFHLGDALYRTGQHDEVADIVLATVLVLQSYRLSQLWYLYNSCIDCVSYGTCITVV